MKSKWKKRLTASTFVLVLVLMFYLGVRYGDLRDRIVNEIPGKGFVAVDFPSEPAARPIRKATFVPVRLENSALAARRVALELKIFGTRRAPAHPTITDIDTSAFASRYTGRAAFEKHYRRVFADHRIQVAQIAGAFDEIEGYRWRSIWLGHGAESPKGLFVYHHGHDGNPLAFESPNVVIRAMIERGYDIIIHCMPGIGWNNIGQVRIKTWDGWGYLTDSRNEQHALFSMVDTGDGHFIRFFVEPVLASIDLAMRQRAYRQVVMAGHSGGGWATTIAAALDERIGLSVSYAGSLPFFARHKGKDLGDAEQTDSAFYREFPYPLLYELASGSAATKRVHYQVFNANDSCCFDSDSAATLQRYVSARPPQPDRDLRIAIVRNTGHYMAADAILEIIGRLGPSQATR
jgi:hypothetical protein